MPNILAARLLEQSGHLTAYGLVSGLVSGRILNGRVHRKTYGKLKENQARFCLDSTYYVDTPIYPTNGAWRVRKICTHVINVATLGGGQNLVACRNDARIRDAERGAGTSRSLPSFPGELREVEIAVFKAFGLRPPRKWRATKRSEAR